MTDNNNGVSQVTFRMKKELLRKLKVHAAQTDANITGILNTLVEDFLDKGAKKR